MNELTVDAADEQATDDLGRRLAELLSPGAVVTLDGPLGAGKTRLVQAFAAAAGVPQGEVTSPTFTLIHEYQGRFPIYHLDAYRLRDEDEFDEIGAAEYLFGQGVALIEWSDRVPRAMPNERLEIRIAVTGPSSRRISLRDPSGRFADVLTRLA